MESGQVWELKLEWPCRGGEREGGRGGGGISIRTSPLAPHTAHGPGPITQVGDTVAYSDWDL